MLAALLPELAVLLPWVAYAIVAPAAPADPLAVDPAFPAVFVFTKIAGALTYVVTPAALVWLSARAVLGAPLRVGEAFRRVGSRFPALLGATIVVGLAVGIGLVFLVVPGVIMAIIFFAYQQAVMVEGKGVADALSRSSDLSEGAWGRVFGVTIVFWVIAILPGIGYAAAHEAVLGTAMLTPAAFAAQTAVESLLWVLIAPVSALGTTLLYFDRRVRTEALDLQDEPVPVALDPVAVPAVAPR